MHHNKNKEYLYIPYRESKLTSLLKQSIGGNSYCLMLACINPCDLFYEENVSTLNYATKATYIRNQPIKNDDPKNKIINELKMENQALRLELDKANETIQILTKVKEDNGNFR